MADSSPRFIAPHTLVKLNWQHQWINKFCQLYIFSSWGAQLEAANLTPFSQYGHAADMHRTRAPWDQVRTLERNRPPSNFVLYQTYSLPESTDHLVIDLLISQEQNEYATMPTVASNCKSQQPIPRRCIHQWAEVTSRRETRTKFCVYV